MMSGRNRGRIRGNRHDEPEEPPRKVAMDLTQPELLTNEDLQELLQSRSVEMTGCNFRSELIQRFRDHVLPLPQRPLPNNRRGKVMAMKRKRSRSPSESGKEKDSQRASSSDQKDLSSPSHPLPDQIDYSRKKIKLSSSSSSHRMHDHRFQKGVGEHSGNRHEYEDRGRNHHNRQYSSHPVSHRRSRSPHRESGGKHRNPITWP